MTTGSMPDNFAIIRRRVVQKDPDLLAILNSYAHGRINKSYAMDRLDLAYYGQLLELMGSAKIALPSLPVEVMRDMVDRVRDIADRTQGGEVKVVVPDAGVLMALAHGDLLDVLFAIRRSSELTITDAAMFGAQQGSNQSDLARIERFQPDHGGRISVEATLLSDAIAQARNGLDPAAKMAPYLGEMGMYGYLNAIYQEPTRTPTIVILEDEWFINRDHPQKEGLQLISLMAFLRFVERGNPVLFHERSLARMVHGMGSQ